jgi:undecaprenyl diphosphate synthase
MLIPLSILASTCQKDLRFWMSIPLPEIRRPPQHVAIIMDGNNRWAAQRHLPGVSGHKRGVKAVRKVIEVAVRLKINAMTLFAFSSENWQRPAAEVSALMRLFLTALKRESERLHEHNIRLRIIGDLSAFSDEIKAYILKAEALTRHNQGLQLNIAANYGGRWDIVRAAKQLAQDVVEGRVKLDAVDESVFQTYTLLSDLPPPDLCIRTSGECRISNFLLWQLAYAELYFTDQLWPDFTEASFYEALEAYSQRTRRFGKTNQQLEEEHSSA